MTENKDTFLIQKWDTKTRDALAEYILERRNDLSQTSIDITPQHSVHSPSYKPLTPEEKSKVEHFVENAKVVAGVLNHYEEQGIEVPISSL